MKKLLTIALMAVLCLTAGAQGTWSVIHREADELKGQSAKDVYVYDEEGVGSVVVWDWDRPAFRLITESGLFHQVMVQSQLCVPVTVGLYDDDGYLKTKLNLILYVESNKNSKWITTGGFYIGGRGNIKKTLAHMKSGKGYVRFVAQLYGQPDFDLRVVPFDSK